MDAVRRPSGRRGLLLSAGLALCGAGCGATWDKTLPPSSELGSPRGYRVTRNIIHLHSPISYDACDGGDGRANASCLDHLRSALCKNRVDFAFLTDHPSHFAEYSIAQASYPMTAASTDTPVTSAAVTVGNQINDCASYGTSSTPILAPGFEHTGIMPIAMTAHLAPQAVATYEATPDAAMVTNLTATSSAVVLIPHTEQKALADLQIAGVDGIEVYNLHANISPTLRTYLGLSPFGDGWSDLIYYFVDPYGEQQPDLAFVAFFRWGSIYTTRWNQMLASGFPVIGVAGSDSHENALAYQANDGERLDSHRRVMRWFSNHYLVSAVTYDQIKAALLAGRGWIVFEAFGTPVGMDYYATANGTTVGVGASGTYVAGQTTITVPLPTLHASSPTDGNAPTIRILLKKVGTGGADTTVATATGAALSYTVTSTGIYRAEVYITPNQLGSFLGYKRATLLRELPWIITNPITLN